MKSYGRKGTSTSKRRVANRLYTRGYQAEMFAQGKEAYERHSVHYNKRQGLDTMLYDSYDSLMCMAAMEMMQPPPSIVVEDSNDIKKWHKRQPTEMRQLLHGLCTEQAPLWVPDIIWSFAKYESKRNMNTSGQFVVLQAVYRQFCWEGIFKDPAYPEKEFPWHPH